MTREWTDLREQPEGVELVVDAEGDRWELGDNSLWHCLADVAVEPRHWHRLMLDYGPLYEPGTEQDRVWWAVYNAAVAEGLDSYDAEQVANEVGVPVSGGSTTTGDQER